MDATAPKKNKAEIACTALTLYLLILQGRCKFCHKELFSLREAPMDTVPEVKNLKKQLKNSSNADQQPESKLSQVPKGV